MNSRGLWLESHSFNEFVGKTAEEGLMEPRGQNSQWGSSRLWQYPNRRRRKGFKTVYHKNALERGWGTEKKRNEALLLTGSFCSLAEL